MIYLASAYTHFDRKVMEERFEQVAMASAFLINKGHHIYSPIVHCHPLAIRFALRHDYEFWAQYNHSLIQAATEFWVFDDPYEAWRNSNGVKGELIEAGKQGKRKLLVNIKYFDNTYEVTDL